MKKRLAVALLCLFAAGAAFGQGRYKQFTVNLGGSVGTGVLDFDGLENTYSYSAWFSYWLNDTSTIDVSVGQFLSTFPVDLYESGRRPSETDGKFSSIYGTVGFRYQPDWDFFLDFGVGLGAGYEVWMVDSDDFSSRSGDGLMYYGVADVEYPIRSWVSIGAYVQPIFYPLKDRLETSVNYYNVPVGTKPSGKTEWGEKEKKEYATLSNSVMMLGGVWIKFRVY